MKTQYEELKDEQFKTLENRINSLKTEQAEIENKLLRNENEMKYNIQGEHNKKLSNFIMTK